MQQPTASMTRQSGNHLIALAPDVLAGKSVIRGTHGFRSNSWRGRRRASSRRA